MIATEYRPDCLTRWKTIKGHMGSITGKSIVDIGCHNGYFCEQFIESGGEVAVGVEVNGDCIAECRKIDTPKFVVYDSLTKVNGIFDFCLYLDLHYDSRATDGYLRWAFEHAKVSFIATSGDGNLNNARLKKDLEDIFMTVEETESTNYADRMIFKCQ